MTNLVPYNIGDRIIQYCFGLPEAVREVLVTAKFADVKNGEAGFDGVTSGGLTVWGYDDDVAVNITSQESRP